MRRNTALRKGIGKPKQVGEGVLRFDARMAQKMLNNKVEHQSIQTYIRPGRGASGESSN